MIQPTFIVTSEESKEGYSILVLEPLEKGYGHTLGNALRRVMLSSLEGVAITSVRIRGAAHQFTTLEGMSEDVVELVLNLKQIRLKAAGDGPFTLSLDVKGKSEVTGADIDASAGVEVVNKDLHLATVSEKTSLSVEMIAELGQGYSLASERKGESIGVIPVDALFSPVSKVSYEVESTRVGRRTDFDKLVMQVWTDGTIEPKAALEKAAEILVSQFQQIYNPVIVQRDAPQLPSEQQNNQSLKLTVEELDLPTRIANALRRGGYKIVEDLVTAERSSIAKVKNLGEKSVVLVEEALNKRGVSLKD